MNNYTTQHEIKATLKEIRNENLQFERITDQVNTIEKLIEFQLKNYEKVLTEKQILDTNLTGERLKIQEILASFENYIDNNIYQLEAVKMLFDLMNSGDTHRQKELFTNKSKHIIDMQIQKIKHEKDFLLLKDLPF